MLNSRTMYVGTVSYVLNTHAAHLSLPLAFSLPPSAAEPDPQPKSDENEPTVIPLYEVSSFYTGGHWLLCECTYACTYVYWFTVEEWALRLISVVFWSAECVVIHVMWFMYIHTYLRTYWWACFKVYCINGSVLAKESIVQFNDLFCTVCTNLKWPSLALPLSVSLSVHSNARLWFNNGLLSCTYSITSASFAQFAVWSNWFLAQYVIMWLPMMQTFHQCGLLVAGTVESV